MLIQVLTYYYYYLVPTVTIDTSLKYQEILGFGGAFTDVTGINLARLSAATERHFIKYFVFVQYEKIKF